MKILLITYHPLIAINGGTYMYKSIIEKIPKNELIWVATGASDKTKPKWMNDFKTYIFPSFIFKKNWLRIFSRSPFHLFHYLVLYNVYVPIISKKIVKLINIENPDIIWIEGVKQTFKIGNILLNKTKIPIHTSINDDYRAQTTFVENRFILRKYFKRLLFDSISLDFISEGMRELYQEEFNYQKNNYKIFWIGNKIESLPAPTINRNIKKIILYGSLHGVDSINAFSNALQHLNDDVTLDIYSQMNYSFLEKKYHNVFYKGSVHVNALAKLIQEYDLVYVPLSFERNFEIVVKTSVPSKMNLALQCQIPILAHGPEYAQNVKFVEKYAVGFTIKTNNFEDIVKKIKSITIDDRIAASKTQSIVYNNCFNTDRLASNFLHFLKEHKQ